MDYYAIGQRIRKVRKAQGLSQEQLAERVQISVTHMSHIETGNTKLSLQVLVDLAMTLGVRTDTLLFDDPSGIKNIANDEIQAILETCSPAQARFLADLMAAAKRSLDANL